MGNSQQSIAVNESWLRRVAIVVSSLPASVGPRLLHGVDSETLARVEHLCESLGDVPATERNAVLREFRQRMFSAPMGTTAAEPIEQANEEYQDEFDITGARDSASPGSKDLLNSQVASVVSQWELPRSFHSQQQNESPFAFLDDVDDEIVVQLLSREHAQTIALVFASITPKQAARILPRLDLDTQSETVRRIGRLDEIPAATAAEVAAHLREGVNQLQHQWNNPAHQTLRAIIDAMPRESAHQNGPTPQLRETDEPVAEVNDSVFFDEAHPVDETEPADNPLSTEDVHQHLIQLPPQILCQALGQVRTREALLTLCGLPNQVAEQALSMLPRGRAKEVRRGMANLASVQLREIDEAKEAVALASLPFDHGQPQAGRSLAA